MNDGEVQMGRFFNYENGIFTFLGKVTDVIIISMLWLVCSIPIFTLGASTTALYYTMNKTIRHNRGYAWKEFFGSFKSNFKQSTVVWLVALAMYIVASVDIFLVRQMKDIIKIASFLNVVFIVMLVFVTMWCLYVFPYMARFENTTKQTMKNCILIAIGNFPRTILLLILFAVAVVAFFFVPMSSLFVPGVYMWIATFIIEPAFRKYMTPEDLKAEEIRNSDYIVDDFELRLQNSTENEE